MYYREISGNGIDFGLPYGSTYTLAFSRLLYGKEVLIAYNVSGESRDDRVIVDSTLHPDPSRLTYLHGKSGEVPVHTAPSGARFVQLDLNPHQLVILS
jgi:alpha-amylase